VIKKIYFSKELFSKYYHPLLLCINQTVSCDILLLGEMLKKILFTSNNTGKKTFRYIKTNNDFFIIFAEKTKDNMFFFKTGFKQFLLYSL
jgi:hypothetical protein